MNRAGTAVAFLSAALCATAGAAPVLVEDGKPRMTIVVSESNHPASQLAARELQHYVKKITGATLPIVRDDEEVVGPKVLVGESKFTRALGLDNQGFKPQEYLVRNAGDDLVLMGRDERPGDPPLRPTFFVAPSSEIYQQVGSLYAVDTFLEKRCGVRWYLPTEFGEVVPKARTLACADIDLRRSPSMRHRQILGYSGLPATLWRWKGRNEKIPSLPCGELLRWERRLKVAGCEPFVACHSFYGYFKRFGKTHPDWFADGKPQALGQMCYSNPEFLRQVVQDARDYFDGKLQDEGARALGDTFSVFPMDSIMWCLCPQCLPKLDPTRHGSDLVWGFVAKVAAELAKTHPGKFVSCAAYMQHGAVPEGVAIPANVKVEVCSYGVDMDMKRAWARKVGGDKLYDYEYYIHPEYLRYNMFPSIEPHSIAKNVAALKAAGISGGFICEMDNTYINLGLEHLRLYVTMKLAEDWDQDVDALLDEYYRLFYGPAAEPMRDFFRRVEGVYQDPVKMRPVRERRVELDAKYCWVKLCPPKDLEVYGKLLADAKARTETGSLHRGRVELIEQSVYQAIMIQGSEGSDVQGLESYWDSPLPGFRKVE